LVEEVPARIFAYLNSFNLVFFRQASRLKMNTFKFLVFSVVLGSHDASS